MYILNYVLFVAGAFAVTTNAHLKGYNKCSNYFSDLVIEQSYNFNISYTPVNQVWDCHRIRDKTMLCTCTTNSDLLFRKECSVGTQCEITTSCDWSDDNEYCKGENCCSTRPKTSNHKSIPCCYGLKCVNNRWSVASVPKNYNQGSDRQLHVSWPNKNSNFNIVSSSMFIPPEQDQYSDSANDGPCELPTSLDRASVRKYRECVGY